MISDKQIKFQNLSVLTGLVVCLLAPPLSQAGSVETSGDILQFLIPASCFAMTIYHDDQQGRMQFYKGMGTSILTTWALKLATNQTRPDGRPYSFPSAHTSTAFTGATFIQKRYGWKYGSLAYVGAAYVGWTRYDIGSHYTEDILVGAAVGIISGLVFTTPFEDRDVTILPVADSEGVYIRLSAKW